MAATGVGVGTTRSTAAAPATVRRARRVRPPRVLLHAFLIVTVLVWLAPLVWTVYTSLRPYQDTFRLGYFSIGGHYGFGNFSHAWNQADLIRFYGNTLIVTVPAVVLTLLLASFVAFPTGFCTLVLSNYMRTIPHELTEAALIDGASVWRQFWRVILPLTRPALAALATLEFIFIYNAFFWALVLMSTGDKRPITSALANLQGIYFTDDNLIAAGALLAVLPTLIVYLTLQRQFVRGLTLGATKG